MSNLKLQKRLAAEVAKVGLKRVKIPVEFMAEVQEALTKNEIILLIKEV